MDYKDAFTTLEDAVVNGMTDHEKEEWDKTYLLPEESRLELLVSYLEHLDHAAPRTMDTDAVAQHEIMQSYMRAGFNHDDAFELLKLTITMGFHAHLNKGGYGD